MNQYATVAGPDTVRLERTLPGPIERVWAYLTEPEKRAKWLAGGPMDLRVGGAVELRFLHADLSAEKAVPERFKKLECGHIMAGRVTHCEPPRLLAYTWGDEAGKDGEVSFELTERGAEVLLILTHRRLPGRKGMISVAGGWHAHVGILEDILHGHAPRGFWSTHATLEAEYERRFPTP
ncbi:MAG: SRPBCC family protein [Hyphomonadaceae bacterium]|jgi:uncharacterized protein YndB with AHSA1/START domain|nr:SRPBCC family protein [Hyphomonadaceae bacterium]